MLVTAITYAHSNNVASGCHRAHAVWSIRKEADINGSIVLLYMCITTINIIIFRVCNYHNYMVLIMLHIIIPQFTLTPYCWLPLMSDTNPNTYLIIHSLCTCFVYKQKCPFAQVDYACQDPLVSFAVSNVAELSNFSSPAHVHSLWSKYTEVSKRIQ